MRRWSRAGVGRRFSPGPASVCMLTGPHLCLQAEREVCSLCNRLQNEEEALEKTQKRLEEACRNQEELEKVADERERCIRACKSKRAQSRSQTSSWWWIRLLL